MSSIGRMTGLCELVIFPTAAITAAGFGALGGLSNLRIIYAQGGSTMTDAGLQALGNCPELEQIMVDGAWFSDEGLTALGGVRHLKFLWLSGTRQPGTQRSITDAGLAAVTGLSLLETLRLDGAGITDAGVNALVQLGNLKELRLDRTQITPAGEARLRAWKPDLKLYLFP